MVYIRFVNQLLNVIKTKYCRVKHNIKQNLNIICYPIYITKQLLHAQYYYVLVPYIHSSPFNPSVCFSVYLFTRLSFLIDEESLPYSTFFLSYLLFTVESAKAQLKLRCAPKFNSAFIFLAVSPRF